MPTKVHESFHSVHSIIFTSGQKCDRQLIPKRHFSFYFFISKFVPSNSPTNSFCNCLLSDSVLTNKLSIDILLKTWRQTRTQMNSSSLTFLCDHSFQTDILNCQSAAPVVYLDLKRTTTDSQSADCEENQNLKKQNNFEKCFGVIVARTRQQKMFVQFPEAFVLHGSLANNWEGRGKGEGRGVPARKGENTSFQCMQ